MAPKLKKQVNAFLLGEDGRITKQAVMVAGAMLAAAALSVKSVEAGCCGRTDQIPPYIGPHNFCVDHSNAVTAPGNATVGHDHHYNHGSHASHGSHGSHGSGGKSCT